VGGVQELYREILEFRKKGKVVISSLGDMAASGGYYIAMATDYIIANPGSIVGSIGVIMNTFNLSRLANRFGVDRVVIKAGRFKDILNAFRGIDQQELNLLQQLVNNTYEQFFEVVKASRKGINENRLRELCDGRIFTGKMAFEYKMVDALGGYYTALEKIKAMLNLPALPDVHIHKSESGLDIMNLLRRGGAQNFYEELKLVFTTGELSSPLFYLFMGF
jgi:protease-4